MPSIDLSRYQAKKTSQPPSSGSKSDFVAFLNKDITFGNNELKDKKKEYFYLELSSLLKAGIDLKSSLELVAGEQHKPKEGLLFSGIKNNVLGGASLSKAMSNSRRFSTYEVFSLEIGEESGKLTEVLSDLARYYQHKIRQRRKIISALTYPCVVLATSLGAVLFMLKFVVPMFGEVFKRFGGELPWLTRQMLGFSHFLEHHLMTGTIAILLVVTAIFSQRKTQRFQKLSTTLILGIPFIGNLVKKIYLARFCNTMRLLINARLPLLKAISLSGQMIGYYPISSSLSQVESNILSGKPLYQSLSQFSIYPVKMIQLIKIGEETNKLDYFFEKVSEQYVEEVEYKTGALTQILEPVIIIFLGLVVGLILISVYLPLFQMSNTIQ